MQSVVALVVGASLRARLVRAVGDQAHIAFVSTDHELERATRQLHSMDASIVVITEAHDARRTLVSPTVRRLTREFPDLSVLGYLSSRMDDLRALADLTRAGVTDILIQGLDDEPRSLRESLARAAARTAAAEGLAMLTPLVPQGALPFVVYVAVHAHRPLCVAEVAREVGAARRTIAHTLAHSHLPPAVRLIGWFRVLHAVSLLSQYSRKTTDVAATLRFPSLAAMDNLFRGYLGSPPKIVRGPDGRSIALASFQAEIRASRLAGEALVVMRRDDTEGALLPARRAIT